MLQSVDSKVNKNNLIVQKSSAPIQVLGKFERMCLNCQNTAKKNCQIRIKDQTYYGEACSLFLVFYCHINFRPTKLVANILITGHLGTRKSRQQAKSYQSPQNYIIVVATITCTNDLATLKQQAIETEIDSTLFSSFQV